MAVSEKTNITYVSDDGSFVKAITDDFSTRPAGLFATPHGDLWLSSSVEDPQLDNQVHYISGTDVRSAISGGPVTLPTSPWVSIQPGSRSIVEDDRYRLWTAGYETENHRP